MASRTATMSDECWWSITLFQGGWPGKSCTTSYERQFWRAILLAKRRTWRLLCLYPYRSHKLLVQASGKPSRALVRSSGEDITRTSCMIAIDGDARHRLQFVYVFKPRSWLNQVEIWFSIMVPLGRSEASLHRGKRCMLGLWSSLSLSIRP